MRLIIVRHEETIENRKKILQGHKHGTLTRKGILQHKKLAKRLINEKIDLIYSSDLKRTKHLAKEIQFYHKVPVYYNRQLREKRFGIFEGKTWGSVRKYAEEKGIDYPKFRPPKGESFNDMKKRTENFYKKVINRYKNTNKTILFVTHGGFIIHLLLHVLNLDHKNTNMGKIIPLNTAVTILEINKKGNRKAKLVNCIKHL